MYDRTLFALRLCLSACYDVRSLYDGTLFIERSLYDRRLINVKVLLVYYDVGSVYDGAMFYILVSHYVILCFI